MVKGMWPGPQVEVKGICMEFLSRTREREEVLKGLSLKSKGLPMELNQSSFPLQLIGN